MPTNQPSKVLQHLRRVVLLNDGAGMTDGQLLGCFIEHRDEAAFAALVRRHGPMVWGVCRRLLDHHDAEDAFQATFLVLFRKATSIRPREMVANWLYGVAHQAALQARRTTVRRRAREKQVTEMPEPAVAEQNPWNDLQPVLDQELSRLPANYRAVIVLCDLEGKTRKEAAQQLAVPEGTVASRLARARVMLASQLAQRGVSLSGGLLAAVLTHNVASAAVPSSVVSRSIHAAGLLAAGQVVTAGAISARVATLMEGMINTMFVNSIKRVLAMMLMIAALIGTAGLIFQSQPAGQLKAKPKLHISPQDSKDKADKQAVEKEKLRVLIDNVLKAHGGEDKLNKLQFTMTVKHSNGEVQQYFVQPPKNFRWETQWPPPHDTMKKRICILMPTGRQWWWKYPNGKIERTIYGGVELSMDYWLDYVKFFGPRQVLRLRDPDHRVTLLDEEIIIDGRPAVGVEVTYTVPNKHYTPELKMYFDKERHLLVKLAGNIVSYQPIYYSDYKKFDGIPIAQKEIDGYFNGVVTDFRVVDRFDPALFEQP